MTSSSPFDVVAEVVRLRRALHSIAETAFQERKTASLVLDYLRDVVGLNDDDITAGVGQTTGLIALIRSDDAAAVRDGDGRRCIAIRADMDALPIQEVSTAHYKSEHDGVMHACGHDAHMAMLLVAARVLQGNRGSFKGIVKLIFQPAEEMNGGAKVMVDAGVLHDPDVDAIYGAHVWNYCPTGEVHLSNGPIMASSDRMMISVVGRGGHGAHPQGTADSLLAAAHLTIQLQTIVSRSLSPLDSAVLTIGRVQGGTAPNIIADRTSMSGIVRSFRDDVRDTIVDRIRQICEGVERSFDVITELQFERGCGPTVNAVPNCVDIVRKSAAIVVGSSHVCEVTPTMAAEDFSCYLDHCPGCFFFIGSSPPGPDQYPHHKSNFDIDEGCLTIGVKIWVELVQQELAI